LLLSLGFFFSFFSLSNFLEELLFFFFLEIGLVFNLIGFSFSSLSNLFLFLLKPLLELLHFLLVFDVYNLFDNIRISHHALSSHHFSWVCSIGKHGKLVLEFCDFILVFSQKGIFGVFVDLWLVFNVLGS
jgi:hypothetical protein